MEGSWDDLFDAWGVKSVSGSDRDKKAFLPNEEQRAALALSGHVAVDGGPGPIFLIRILGDDERKLVRSSYYRSLRNQERAPEPRMGRELISAWLHAGDEVLIGSRDRRLFVAKVQDESTHERIAADLHHLLMTGDDPLKLQALHPFDGNGSMLDAEFSVAGTGPVYTLTMECADGRKRNLDYKPALDLLLSRLAFLNARLLSGVVASTVATRRSTVDGLPIALNPEPFRLPLTINDVDAAELRRALGRAGAAVGKPAKTSGNTTKRIALKLWIDPDRISTAGALASLLTGAATGVLDDDDDFRDMAGVDEDDLRILSETNSPDVLERLSEKYRDASPQVRRRLSTQIERGRVGDEVKRASGFRCMICEGLGQKSEGIMKRSGGRYVEAHHVLPVATLAAGTLAPTNVISVCANHHRQIHYGDVRIESADLVFRVSIDGATIEVPRLFGR